MDVANDLFSLTLRSPKFIQIIFKNSFPNSKHDEYSLQRCAGYVSEGNNRCLFCDPQETVLLNCAVLIVKAGGTCNYH
jgi:hypothetical protein